MAKKLNLVLAAVAMLAFALPMTASASSITSSAGKLATVGSTLTLTGTDVNITSPLLGAITCEKLTFHVTLDVNAGGTVTGTHAAEVPGQTGCVNNTNPVSVTSMQVTDLVSTTPGTGTMSFVEKLDILGTTKLTCTFTGTTVPFTYSVGTDTITFSNAAGITASPGACGSPDKLDGSFTIEIGSTPVILD